MIYTSIGNTDIITLSKVVSPGKIFVKLEKNNPTGSVKDRAAFFMIKNAENNGLLGEHQRTIVEPTSGNTGIALAAIGRSRGYKVILTMPETMSLERRKVLELLGAEVVLTEGAKGMKGAIEKAVELKTELKAFMPDQFSNPANPMAHELTTGPEIIKQMGYSFDGFVAGVGTGGTLSGTGRVLRRFFGECIKIVAVEPEASPVISGGNPGKHKIQGIGAGFVPQNLDTTLINEIIQINDDEAYEMVRRLAKEEGLFLGISSAANILASIKLSEKIGENKKIVTIGCDHGERYLSNLL